MVLLYRDDGNVHYRSIAPKKTKLPEKFKVRSILGTKTLPHIPQQRNTLAPSRPNFMDVLGRFLGINQDTSNDRAFDTSLFGEFGDQKQAYDDYNQRHVERLTSEAPNLLESFASDQSREAVRRQMLEGIDIGTGVGYVGRKAARGVGREGLELIGNKLARKLGEETGSLGGGASDDALRRLLDQADDDAVREAIRGSYSEIPEGSAVFKEPTPKFSSGVAKEAWEKGGQEGLLIRQNMRSSGLEDIEWLREEDMLGYRPLWDRPLRDRLNAAEGFFKDNLMALKGKQEKFLRDAGHPEVNDLLSDFYSKEGTPILPFVQAAKEVPGYRPFMRNLINKSRVFPKRFSAYKGLQTDRPPFYSDFGNVTTNPEVAAGYLGDDIVDVEDALERNIRYYALKSKPEDIFGIVSPSQEELIVRNKGLTHNRLDLQKRQGFGSPLLSNEGRFSGELDYLTPEGMWSHTEKVGTGPPGEVVVNSNHYGQTFTLFDEEGRDVAALYYMPETRNINLAVRPDSLKKGYGTKLINTITESLGITPDNMTKLVNAQDFSPLGARFADKITPKWSEFPPITNQNRFTHRGLTDWLANSPNFKGDVSQQARKLLGIGQGRRERASLHAQDMIDDAFEPVYEEPLGRSAFAHMDEGIPEAMNTGDLTPVHRFLSKNFPPNYNLEQYDALARLLKIIENLP